MRRFLSLSFLFFLSSSIFCVEYFLKWEKGQYVTYYTEYKDKRWEAYNISILEQKGKNYFLLFRITTRKYSLEYLISSEEDYKDVKGSIHILDSKAIRGKVSEDTKAIFISKIYNIFNIPALFKYRLRQGEKLKVNRANLLGITNSYELLDEWKEFGYTLKHYMNENVPILYMIGTDASDRSFKTTLTSYGTKSVTSENAFSYIDFSNLKESEYISFSMKIPATWVLGKRKDMSGKEFSVFYHELGGNNQAGYILVQLFNRKNVDMLKLYKTMLDNKCLGENLKKGYEFRLVEENSNNTNEMNFAIYVHEFRQKDKTGHLVSAAIKSDDNKKCAAVSIFTTHKKGYESLSAGERISLFKEMVNSFRFR